MSTASGGYLCAIESQDEVLGEHYAAEWGLGHFLPRSVEGVRGEFSRLHLIFRLHCIEVEKRKLLEQMVPGAPILSIEAVVINLRSIVELSRLEMSVQSVGALIPQGERLLEAIQTEPEFVVPPATRTASESVAVSSEPKPRLYGPYLFRGDHRIVQRRSILAIPGRLPDLD